MGAELRRITLYRGLMRPELVNRRSLLPVLLLPQGSPCGVAPPVTAAVAAPRTDARAVQRLRRARAGRKAHHGETASIDGHLTLQLPARPLDRKLSSMGAPKRKHPEKHEPAREPTPEEREEAEMRADVEDYDQAKAEWEAAGRPPGISLDEIKREFGAK